MGGVKDRENASHHRWFCRSCGRNTGLFSYCIYRCRAIVGRLCGGGGRIKARWTRRLRSLSGRIHGGSQCGIVGSYRLASSRGGSRSHGCGGCVIIASEELTGQTQPQVCNKSV